MSLEKVILRNLIDNEEYTRKVYPFLKNDYFKESDSKVIFNLYQKYFDSYNTVPTKKELIIDLGKLKLTEDQYNEAKLSIASLEKSEENLPWLLERTEEFCKDAAIYNAILKSIEVIEDKTGNVDRSVLPDILRDALGVSFDTNIGHDYLEDAEARWELAHTLKVKYPFDLKYLNKITKGGLEQKTLNVVMAGTGVGKSILLCHAAAAWLSMGYNVLYVTLEMSEEKISERIDANLLDISLDNIHSVSKSDFMAGINKIKEKTKGRLKVKEYPQGQAHANHIRFLLNEYKVKENYVPDIVIIDYMNICASYRIKMGATNSYGYIKSIAEELRGLAQEYGFPILTATQTNRDGLGASDLSLQNTSESIGGPMTADLFFAMVQTEEMANKNQMLFIQLKNRYNDLNDPNKFIIGLDKKFMRFYDVEESAQKGISGGPEDMIANDIKSKFEDFK